MRIGICTMEKFDNRTANAVGSSRIRARWLFPYWPGAEEYVVGKEYDVLIFQKVYWNEMYEHFEGIKILDICDPDWLEGKPVFEFIDKVDAVVTSTPALADYIQRMRPDALVKCIPDRVYLPEHEMKKEHNTELRTVAWFGYSQNIHYIQKAFDDIIAKGLTLVVISNQPYNPPIGFQNLRVQNVVYEYPGVNKELVKYDAVLLPETDDDLKGKYKSNNKTLQAWALGVPVIREPEDIDRLMSKEAREKEAQDKRKEVEELWDVKTSAEEYKELIEEVRKRKSANNPG